MKTTITRALIDTRHSFLPHLKGQTHYHRVGPDNGPVVVIMSSATLPMAVRAPVVAPLVGCGFQIVRYDLPGGGHTPLEGIGPSFQLHIDQLHHLLEGLTIHHPVHLIGLASGALIVAAYAERYRARVARACLIAPDGARNGQNTKHHSGISVLSGRPRLLEFSRVSGGA